MMISLFEHNRIAYEEALFMLKETGKAAVIHPTGTGKSFIAFKLCEQFSQNRICWLSPSEYIFKTQIENLKAVSNGFEPQNISFFTFAKLMHMNNDELLEIRPDYIILDEFHRCGAEMWGKGVQALLTMYPEVPILGLSATSIRYLDNQRDMANELFDGNVASEMTLGEAIVRGILNPPKYVLSLYSYQKDLEKYKYRVQQAKNSAVREKAEKELEALRRALEQADGLDEIFYKHMKNPAGKFIVFCSNFDHMQEMIANVPEWFGKVDSCPHVYEVYSDDSETDKAFAAFKADRSEHLKLLFCIDMLNEGIHLDDISGVILLRPTISPIIYKQQIGRALSACKTNEPIIFDIVNNIENLYSIDSIQEEMRVAMTYYRLNGEHEKIVNERFKIIDEMRDCKELFERLNDTLTASWETMYTLACAYYKEHGNLLVPRRYQTSEGHSLGSWISTQRRVRSGQVAGILSEQRIAKLDAIGMVWDDKGDRSWKKFYNEAQNYYKQNGDLNVPSRYETESGAKLGSWISNLRTYRKYGIQRAYLTQARIEQLDALGMIWDVSDELWQRSYAAAAVYYAEYGDLEVPVAYTSPDGIKLGVWIRNMRKARKGIPGSYAITPKQIAALDEIGMVWDNAYNAAWEYGYQQAQLYYQEHGDLNVPTMYVNDNGFALGRWLKKHTESRKGTSTTAIKVTPIRREKLNLLGMNWDKAPEPWEVRYALAKDYYMKNGNLNVPGDYVVEGIWLSKWLNEQKQIYYGKRKNKTLTDDQVQRLEAIGMEWESLSQRTWNERFREAKAYYNQNNHLNIPADYVTADGKNLKLWINRQKTALKKGSLSEKQVNLLQTIGIKPAEK